MFNFFSTEPARNDRYKIAGQDYNHLKNVLRIKAGEEILVSYNEKSDLCAVENFDKDYALVYIIKKDYKNFELPVKITLFQGLPKSDKMEFIIQKAVELGVLEIVPVETARAIVKLDKKKAESKTARWQAIAESGAKQSKRNLIPKVSEVLSFSAAVEKAKSLDLLIVPYENKNGMQATASALSKIKNNGSVGVFIGPEGGFEQSEIELLESIGAQTVSLGNRILRTETAALAALSMIMLYAEIKL